MRPDHLAASQWLRLLGLWLLGCVPIGVVMYLVTTFLFAFSGSQGGMVPIVDSAPWIVDASTLLVGAATLTRTRSMGSASRVMLFCTLGAWLLTVGIEWLLSFRFGTVHVDG